MNPASVTKTARIPIANAHATKKAKQNVNAPKEKNAHVKNAIAKNANVPKNVNAPKAKNVHAEKIANADADAVKKENAIALKNAKNQRNSDFLRKNKLNVIAKNNESR